MTKRFASVCSLVVLLVSLVLAQSAQAVPINSSTTTGYGLNDSWGSDISTRMSNQNVTVGGARIPWREIEPSDLNIGDPGWDWTEVDRVLNAAKNNNKWAAISVMFKSQQVGRICRTTNCNTESGYDATGYDAKEDAANTTP